MKFPSKIIGKKQPIKNFNIKKIQTANPKKLKNSAVKNKNLLNIPYFRIVFLQSMLSKQ